MEIFGILKWTPGDIKCLIDLYEKYIFRFEAVTKKCMGRNSFRNENEIPYFLQGFYDCYHNPRHRNRYRFHKRIPMLISLPRELILLSYWFTN